MHRTWTFAATAALALAGATACRDTATSTEPPTAAAAPSPEPFAAPAATAWKDMNREQKAGYMKKVVLPTMKPEFAAFDPGDFGNMACFTCHGKAAKERRFKMPNPDLPKLPAPGDAAGWKALQAKEPDAVKFMGETVVPKMAHLLGEPPYDPATGQGFGCFRCHTAK